jgi:putative transposase
MKQEGPVSKHITAQYKPTKVTCNECKVGNVLNRNFSQDEELKVIVSDLTYVRVQHKWHIIYVC